MRLHLVKARLMNECENIIPDHALVGVKLTALSTSAAATAATGAGVGSTAPLVTIAVVVVVTAAAAVLTDGKI